MKKKYVTYLPFNGIISAGNSSTINTNVTFYSNVSIFKIKSSLILQDSTGAYKQFTRHFFSIINSPGSNISNVPATNSGAFLGYSLSVYGNENTFQVIEGPIKISTGLTITFRNQIWGSLLATDTISGGILINWGEY